MTGAELAKRFLEYSQNGAPPRAEDHDAMATLFGVDEVHVDFDAKTVVLPGFGLVQCPTLEKVVGIDWYATVPVPGQGMQFFIGHGDPYKPGAGNPLPHKDGFFMALPYAVLSTATAGMNRAQRRAMRKG